MTRLKHIHLHQISYQLSNEKFLFKNLVHHFASQKVGLLGRNGIGKTTLLQIILGLEKPTQGTVQVEGEIAYCPQSFSLTKTMTVADVLNISDKLAAIKRIEKGSVNPTDFECIGDDWDCLAEAKNSLQQFALSHLPLSRKVIRLSGGERTRLFLAKTFFTKADFLILDEPSNNLDSSAKQLLSEAIKSWKKGLLIVTHDRSLLQLVDSISELTALGLKSYGGNYDFYCAGKKLETEALHRQLEDSKKAMKKAENSVQGSREKHERRRAKGVRLRRSGSIDKMGADSKQGRSEKTQSKLLTQSERQIKKATENLGLARSKLENECEINIELPKTQVPNGKVVLEVEGLSFEYPDNARPVLNDFNFKIQGPERVALSGGNGSGKTTLIKLIVGELKSNQGSMYCLDQLSYLDQHCSALDDKKTVLENFQSFNPDIEETRCRLYLAQFLFRNKEVLKPASTLSGGERLRALLCCVLMAKEPPQLLILDEPTNHLDLESLASLESALACYQGALLVVSHDAYFLENIGIERRLALPDHV